MKTQSLGTVLRSAVFAGLIAGTVAAGFHLLLTEGVVDHAIEIEEQLSPVLKGTPEMPVVSRSAQRWGLVVGFLLYGAAWGLLLGALSYLAQPLFSSRIEVQRGFFLTVILGWSVAIFPWLKYPANPPGVGDPDTISYRQGLYLGFIVLSVLGTVLALELKRWLRRAPWSIALVLYAVYLVVVYLALPSNPDPVRMPAEVVQKFRALSLAGMIIFWLVIGGAFAWLLRMATHPLFRQET
jgi:predicted cobalt transporter CbtA